MYTLALCDCLRLLHIEHIMLTNIVCHKVIAMIFDMLLIIIHFALNFHRIFEIHQNFPTFICQQKDSFHDMWLLFKALRAYI